MSVVENAYSLACDKHGESGADLKYQTSENRSGLDVFWNGRQVKLER